MSYDEEQKRSRIVVETPHARREVSRVETARVPERNGISAGVVAALVIGAVALVTIIFLFLMNRQDEAANVNARAATVQPSPIPQTTIIQQPAPQQQQPPPTVIVQQPAVPPSQPIVIPPSTSSSSSTTTTESAPAKPSGPDDTTIQSYVDKKLSDSPTFTNLGITAIVLDGKVTLTGTVDTPELKRQAETLVKSVRGVRSVDNQIAVTGG